MKKLYTVLLGATLPLLAWSQAKNVPYESQFYQDVDWVVHNMNDDSSTWKDDNSSAKYEGSGYSQGKKYTYHSSNAANDWLIGPAIHLEAGKEYKVKFFYNNENHNENIALYMGSSGEPSDLLAATCIQKIEGKQLDKKYYTNAFTVDATGDYHFGLHCYSPKNEYWVYVTGFQVRENVFAPGSVTNLAVSPGADRAMTATLTWDLPTTDIDGMELPAGYTYDEIRIYRDGVQVNTPNLAADATTWTDTEAQGLTSGKHTYAVVCVVNGAASPEASVLSKYIGPIAPQALPYNANIPNMDVDEFETFWSQDKGRDSGSETTHWEMYTSAYSDNYIRYSKSSTYYDEWLISPEINFTKAGVYRLKMKVDFSPYSEYKFSVYTGNGTSLGGYTDLVQEWTRLGSSVDIVTYVNITEPCVKSIAMHIDAYPNYYTFALKSFEIEEWHVAPEHISELALTVPDDRSKVDLKWKNPSTTNTGTELTEITKIEIYCDGEVAATLTDNLTPGAETTFSHVPATNGTHQYKVLPYLGEFPPDSDPMALTSPWVGDETQTLPYNTSFLSTDATRILWSGFDANGDGKTWSVDPATDTGRLAKVTEFTQHDDYLLSPYMNFDKPGYYMATYTIKGGGSNYRLETGLVSDKTNVVSTFTKTGDEIKLPAQSWGTDYPVTFNIAEAGNKALAVHTVNEGNPAVADDKAVEVTKVQLRYVPVTPTKPLELTATEAPQDALKATVKWTNPTTSNIADVTPVIAKATISRKLDAPSQSFEEVAVITEGLTAGEETSWTDETITAPGVYLYQVVLEGPDGKDTNAYAQTATGWVGSGMPFPVSYNMEDDDPGFVTSQWRIFNVNGDTRSDGWGDYEDVTWEMSYYGSYIEITSTSNVADDWATSSYYSFNAGDEYKMTVKSYTSSDDPVTWELWHGKTQMWQDMDVKIADITTSAMPSVKQDDSFILVIKDPSEIEDTPAEPAEGDEIPRIVIPAGKGTIGLHLATKGQVTVKGFKVEVLKRATTGVTISEETAELTEGETLQLTATVAPEDATDKTVTWASSDAAIATVDADGLVTAVTPGEVEITASCAGFTATCALTVKKLIIAAETVTVAAPAEEMTEGDTMQLTATVAPDNTTDKTIVWSSDDEAVATVNAEGLVTAVAPGTVTITAACGEATGSATITVKARVIPVESITLDKNEAFGSIGMTIQLTATVTPDNATDKTVTWSSDNEAVATVDAEGLVSCVADGEAIITARCGDLTATCKVKVETSGLALIPADARADARFYTLQGIEVKAENLTEGFYIARYMQDGKVVSLKIRL